MVDILPKYMKLYPYDITKLSPHQAGHSGQITINSHAKRQNFQKIKIFKISPKVPKRAKMNVFVKIDGLK